MAQNPLPGGDDHTAADMTSKRGPMSAPDTTTPSIEDGIAYLLTLAFLNRPQTAKVTGLSVPSVDRAIKAGDIPSIRVGRRVLVPTAQLLRTLGAAPEEVVGSGGDAG